MKDNKSLNNLTLALTSHHSLSNWVNEISKDISVVSEKISLVANENSRLKCKQKHEQVEWTDSLANLRNVKTSLNSINSEISATIKQTNTMNELLTNSSKLESSVDSQLKTLIRY